VVLLDGSSSGVKEAILDVALKLEGVLVVGAIDLLKLKVSGIVEGATLVLITEAEESNKVRREGVVGLILKLVTVRRLVGGHRVGSAIVDGGLTGRSVAIGSADRNGIAEVGDIAILVGDNRLPYGIELDELLAFAGDAVPDEIMPFALQRPVFKRKAGVEVLIALLARGRDAEEVVSVGCSAG
jgi:hypothetical protein